MKTCPLCRRSYEDDSLVFCLDDGTRLVAREDQADPNATWHLPQAPPASEAAPTVMPPRPTVPSPQPTITARPDQYQYRPAVNDEPSNHKRNPLPWILAIGAGSFAAHYSMTRAMKLADATVVVPIDFIRLPLIAVVGAAVIFAGTYYSLRRERI